MLESEREALTSGLDDEDMEALKLQAWDFWTVFTRSEEGKRVLACLMEMSGVFHTVSPDDPIALAKTVAKREFYNEIELLIKYAQAEGAGNE
ncbi:MAG: hypothetical protein KDH09_03345 [Chrysiogenetes bacterium]|nr:hypothetical protein [Chrysiogenetes bacterium]